MYSWVILYMSLYYNSINFLLLKNPGLLQVLWNMQCNGQVVKWLIARVFQMHHLQLLPPSLLSRCLPVRGEKQDISPTPTCLNSCPQRLTVKKRKLECRSSYLHSVTSTGGIEIVVWMNRLTGWRKKKEANWLARTLNRK